MDADYILSLMPAADGNTRTIYGNATNGNIITVLEKSFPKAVAITRKAAKHFRGSNDTESAQNVWNFLKQNIQYKADGLTNQDIRLPNRLLSSGTGDCKSYALFTNAILYNLGLRNVCFRYASYPGRDYVPTHVYSVAKDERGNEIITDAVYDQFNAEKYTPKNRKRDSCMTVRTLTGWPLSPGDSAELQEVIRVLRNRLRHLPVESIERMQIYAQLNALKKANGVGNIFKTGKTVFLAPARDAFLALVAVNVHGFASHLAASIAKDSGRVRKTWEKLGGNFSKLVNRVNRAKNKKKLLGIGAAALAPFAAVLVAAAPVIAALAPVLKSLVPSAATEIDQAVSDLQSSGGNYYDPTQDGSTVGDDESKGFSLSSIPTWGWAAGAGALLLLTRKQHKLF